MILYSATKTDFAKDILANQIEKKLINAFMQRLGRRTGSSEIDSWRNSLIYMNNIISDTAIPNDARVALEYKLPHKSQRIDFILSGQDETRKDTVVIVELKQWTTAEKTEMDAMVTTHLGGSNAVRPHPSYQAWTYAAMLQDYNATIQDEGINLVPCAYLHNCEKEEVLRDPFYQTHLDRAPLFLREDSIKLTEFIKRYVKHGDRSDVMYRIDAGKIRPSKSLADNLASMLRGNQEFIMIDDQKVAFETALALARNSSGKAKNVLIIEGGPGSGKSVVAVNLLVELTKHEKTCQYVTKNAAPRTVYERLLTGTMRKSQISNLFVGSGSFVSTERNAFDVLLVDEAHRLNEKSGLYRNEGENQLKEIIESALCSVFFIDESQRVTFFDIGTKEEIERWAKHEKAVVHNLTLSSQFRCAGSDAYIAWLDNSLQVRETANTDFGGIGYDFRVFDDPSEMRQLIVEKNRERNKARLVAGYCWEWKSKKSPSAFDIELSDHFKMRWNLTKDGSAWIIEPSSIEQVGCIHTCQGLELDYIGVIIGPDLVVRDGQVVTDGTKRAKADQSIKGFKSRLKSDPASAQKDADLIIKNTYRTLMTRGMKGCYVYCTDPETRDYFRTRLKVAHEDNGFGKTLGTN